MIRYVCKDWSEVPSHLKTKTSLSKMGIFHLSKPCATVEIYNRVYKLYDVNSCLKIEQSKGNKSLVINSKTKDNYLVLEILTTGKNEDDEVFSLLITDLDGRILFSDSFNTIKKCPVSTYKKYNIDRTKLKNWRDEWGKIEEIIKDKILLIPNTIYAKRLLIQTCEKNKIKPSIPIQSICSKGHIQHKLSILEILKKDDEEPIMTDLLKSVYEFLETVYPNSELFVVRRKAFVYFNKLCDYKTKQGDLDGRNKGNKWLLDEYKSNDFNSFTFDTCEEIISLIYPILKGLGCLPRKF